MDCVKKGTTFGNRTTLLITPPPIEEEEDEEVEDEEGGSEMDEFSDGSDEVRPGKLDFTAWKVVTN